MIWDEKHNTHQKNFLWSTRGSFFQTKDFEFSKETFVELYDTNTDISWCVWKIANNVAKNWLYLVDSEWNQLKDKKRDMEMFSLFKVPTFQDFKLAVFKNYDITWELYIIPSFNLYQEVKGFQVLDSRMMYKKYDKFWNIEKFIQRNERGQTIEYLPYQLAYFIREPSRFNEHDWKSILTGVLYEALNDLSAVRSNYFYYKNNSTPTAVMTFNETLTDEEMQNARDQYNAQFQGVENTNKMLFVWGGQKIEQLSISPRDMDQINQRYLTTEKICATFWVAKSILWYSKDVNYNNWDNNSEEFYKWTVYPNETTFEHILNKLIEMFVPELWRDYSIKCDWEVLPFSDEYIESWRKDVSQWIRTINEVRIDRGLEPVQDENADKLLIPKTLNLLEDVSLDAVLSPDEI